MEDTRICKFLIKQHRRKVVIYKFTAYNRGYIKFKTMRKAPIPTKSIERTIINAVDNSKMICCYSPDTLRINEIYAWVN